MSGNVLTNDTDPDGQPLTAALVTQPSPRHRRSSTPDGPFTYTPAANFNGTDTFTYTVTDGTLRPAHRPP